VGGLRTMGSPLRDGRRSRSATPSTRARKLPCYYHNEPVRVRRVRRSATPDGRGATPENSFFASTRRPSSAAGMFVQNTPSILRGGGSKNSAFWTPPCSSFGGSRSAVSWFGTQEDATAKPSSPGPADYYTERNKSIGRERGRGYTLGFRSASSMSYETIGPGPAPEGARPERQGKREPAYTLARDRPKGVNWDASTLAEERRNPGPGHYFDDERVVKTRAPKYTIGVRRPHQDFETAKKVPGPGAYEHAKHTRSASTFTLTKRPKANPLLPGGVVTELEVVDSPGPARYSPGVERSGTPYAMQDTLRRTPGGGKAYSFSGKGDRLPPRPPATSVDISPGPAAYFGAELEQERSFLGSTGLLTSSTSRRSLGIRSLSRPGSRSSSRGAED